MSRAYRASDYAGCQGGDHSFYYGYEQANEDDDWLFVATVKGKKVMQYTAKDLGAKKFDPPEMVLLLGIARYFELSKS